MSRHFVRIAVVVLLAAAAYAQAPDLEGMDIVLKSMPDGPFAKVEDTNIGRAEFVRLYTAELGRIAREGGPKDLPDVERARLAMEVRRVLVQRTLLYNDALRRRITVPEESVLKAWDAQLAQLQQQLLRTKGREFSESEVLSELGYREREEVLADLERALITEKMRARVVREGELAIDDAEIKDVYDSESERFQKPATLHLKQIYFDTRKNAPQRGVARQRADEARGRLFAGQSFEAVARVASDAPKDKLDMGLLPAHMYLPVMVEVAKTMAPGDISEIFESEFGLHIVTLVSKQEASRATLADAEPHIRRDLLVQRSAQTVDEYCEALEQNGAEVKVFLELGKNLSLANRSLRLETQ